MTEDNGAVRVCLRVRPLLGSEKVDHCQSVIGYPSDTQVTIRDKAFTYDYVYNEDTQQAEVYEGCVAELVNAYLSGYNATILAYGKTFTMGTASSLNVGSTDYGIIPRVIHRIFETIEEKRQTHVYMVKLHDLLDPNKNATPTIREINNEIVVTGVIEEECKSYEEMMRVLERGSLYRSTGSTNMNAHSSRSHAIFTVHLSQKRCIVDDNDQTDEVLTSKFHFVDLAGSERLKRTGAVGARMKEGININQGLLALGNVISALGDATRKGQHVPFRDSKITRLLQDSLGGNSKTLMIACISPADSNFEETLNTLKYANRARNIQNKAVINRDPMSAKLDAMRNRIAELERALAAAGQPIPESSGNSTGMIAPGTFVDKEELQFLKEQSTTFEEEMKRLQLKVKDLKNEMSSMSDRLIMAETQRDTYRYRLEQIQGKNRPSTGSTTGSTTSTPTKDSPRISMGDTSSVVDADTSELTILEENRRQINKLTNKANKYKKDLETALKLLQQYSSGFRPRRSLSKRSHDRTSMDDGDDDIDDDADDESIDDIDEIKDGDDKKQDEIEIKSDDEDDERDEQLHFLSTMSKVKEQEFHRNMQQLTDHHAAISAQLSKKEESLHDLTAESRELNALRQRYETKIKEMEREVAMVQAERDRVLSTLEVTEKDYHTKHQAITSEYEAKLKLLNNNLKDYRDKIKENERLKRVHGADEQKIKQLVEEIAQTKKQRVALQNQINDKSKAHREWMEANRTKMESLQREASKSKLLLKKMTEQLEKQANVLKRRNEEKALLQRQIAKQNQTQKRKDPKSIQSRLYDHTAVTAPNTRLKLRTPLRNKKSPAKRVAYQDATLSDSAAPTITSASVDDLKSAVNEEIEKAVQRQQLIEDLHRLQAQRDTYMDHLRNDEHELLRDDLDEETRRTMEENRNSIRDSLKFVGDQLILNQSKLDDLAGFYSPIKKSNGRGLLTTDQIAAKLFNRNHQDKKEKEIEEKEKQDVDYRLFSRVRIGNLEASKSLILHLVEQAITLKASQLSAQQERQKLEIALAEARAAVINEKIKNEVLLEQQRSNFKSNSTTTTPAGKARTVKRTDEDDDDHTSSHDIHDQTIRSPAKLKAAINVAQQMINGVSPQRKRNNYVEENGIPIPSRTRVSRGKSTTSKETVTSVPVPQRSKSLEPDESEATRTHVDDEEEIIPDQRRSGSIGGGTGDVFSRLTDTHSYTGMYKTIHRDVEHHKPTGRKYASMPPGKKQQRDSEESGTSPSKNIPVTSSSSSAVTSASLASLTTTPSPINTSTSFKAAKSVFTRLTDASQFPAAHRVRHGLEDTSSNPSRTSMPPKPSHRSHPSISNGLPSTSSLTSTSASAASAPTTASPLVIASTGLSRPQRVLSRQSRRNKSPTHRIRSPSDVDLDEDSDYYYDSSTSESSTTSKPTSAITVQTLPTVTSPKSGTPRGYTSGSESDGIDMPSFHSDGETPRAVHPTVASAIGQMMSVPPNIPRPKTSALTAALAQQGVIPMATPQSTSITPGASPAVLPLSSSVDSVASMMDHYDDDTSNDIFVVVSENTSSPEQEKENALYKRAQAEAASAARNGDVKNQHTSQQQKQRQPLGSSTTATSTQPTAPVITDDLTPANVWNAFVQVIDSANIQE